jgi:hypothetical protein
VPRIHAVRALVLAAVALAVASSAVAATPAVRATLKATTPTPVVDDPWQWTVVVRDAKGKPLAAKMKLQILFGNLVVGCWKGAAMTQCTGANPGTWIVFKGRKTGTLTWPAQSVGPKLTFQAVVSVGTKTLRLRTPVTVQPKS